MVEFVQQPLGDVVVSALAVPHAALVAAAQINAESDLAKAFEQLIIGSQRAADEGGST